MESKGSWCVGLRIMPPSCLEMWEPQPLGTLQTFTGITLLCFTTAYFIHINLQLFGWSFVYTLINGHCFRHLFKNFRKAKTTLCWNLVTKCALKMSRCFSLFPCASFFANNEFATVWLKEMYGRIPITEHDIIYSAYNITLCKCLCN
jgi:hypothetical protein